MCLERGRSLDCQRTAQSVAYTVSSGGMPMPVEIESVCLLQPVSHPLPIGGVTLARKRAQRMMAKNDE